MVARNREAHRAEAQNSAVDEAATATLGRAMTAAFKGDKTSSAQYVEKLEKLPVCSDHFVPYWKSTVAEESKDWAAMLEQGKVLQSLSEGQNFREDLPGIYLNLAKAHLELGDRETSIEYATRSVSIVEQSYRLGNAHLSRALSETCHATYRLLAELITGKLERSLAIADRLKARVLIDRIDNSALRIRPEIGVDVRKRIDELSIRMAQGNDVRDELAEAEKSTTLSHPSGAGTEIDSGPINEGK